MSKPATYYAMDLINRGFVVDLDREHTTVDWEQETWCVVEAWKDRDGNPTRWWVRGIARDRGRNDGKTRDDTSYCELTLESRGDATLVDEYARYRRAEEGRTG